MKKLYTAVIAGIVLLMSLTASAATTHTVVSGDTMWKIAVKHQIGLSEIIEANPQITNPALIYPGQVLTIPTLGTETLDYEQEVIRLVNIERAKYGLPALTEDWELSRVARYKSQDMKDKRYFSHTSPTYGSPFDMMKKFGVTYKTAGENIAGQKNRCGLRCKRQLLDANVYRLNRLQSKPLTKQADYLLAVL